MTREKLIVIGNGMAGIRAVEELLERAPDRFDITVFGAEPHETYNRIMLSPVLAGEMTFLEIVTHDRAWYARHNLALRAQEPVIQIDRNARTVTTAKGAVEPYDRILLATGSHPIIIPVPGHDLPGVVSFRDIGDVDRMLEASKSGKRAVVIGGGLLGLEAANGLLARGMEVTVVHLMPTLMERQLDEASGFLLRRELESRGLTILTEAHTEAILGMDKVDGVRLKDRGDLPADLVVMAVGIKPNIDLANAAGLLVQRGVVVTDNMVSSDPAIVAVGECVQHRGAVYGLVAPLYEMAKVAADSLAGIANPGYHAGALSTKLKVTGVDLFSAGRYQGSDTSEDIIFRDAARGVYKRLVIEDDKLVGAVLYGETGDGPWFFQLMREGSDIAPLRDGLIFGPSAGGGGPTDPRQAVAALSDEAEICGCNGVCKGKIVEAIAKKDLKSVDDVRVHTKASASCGSCTGLVETLLELTLGERYSRVAAQPMCPCTDLGHDDVRRLIVAQALKSIPAAMQALEWKTSCGCAKCRPALNYYLLASWPGEYEDDGQSRYINERVHANIQKDGTYSVVPRMWGGITSAAELRAIADVVDKFAIPTVKMTGGQRIDMLGVRKEDLPAVWADLNRAGLVSGHAYGKALRTVKTCVGTDWCRFGTQDSTGLGIKIEKAMWGSWTPAKVKMAVSGCPRNCAEATCKDVGVICVDSGYDIHFAGAAGLDIKGTELLAHAETEEDALEMIIAVVQLYREQGRYLERIYKWTKRVGLEKIREMVFEDDERRKALVARFAFAQTFSQKDPWAERAAGKDANEFRPFAEFVPQAAAE
jgi:nitrite reductase [NAD(P)H] large subunit